MAIAWLLGLLRVGLLWVSALRLLLVMVVMMMARGLCWHLVGLLENRRLGDERGCVVADERRLLIYNWCWRRDWNSKSAWSRDCQMTRLANDPLDPMVVDHGKSGNLIRWNATSVLVVDSDKRVDTVTLVTGKWTTEVNLAHVVVFTLGLCAEQSLVNFNWIVSAQDALSALIPWDKIDIEPVHQSSNKVSLKNDLSPSSCDASAVWFNLEVVVAKAQ